MDNLSPEQRRKNMRQIRSKNTKPEKMVMEELWKWRICFARHAKDLPGKPDIVFRKKKIAVFIDSDFWHGNEAKFIMPMTNRQYWVNKIIYNRTRDHIVTERLKADGWRVLRLWESDITSRLTDCISAIHSALGIVK